MDKNIGQLVEMPVDKCLGVVIAESDWLWGNTYTVVPIENSVLHTKGEPESVLKHQVKAVKHEKRLLTNKAKK